MAASPVSTITDALAGTEGNLLAVAGVGIGIGASVLVLKKGYRLVKGFF